MEDQLGLYSFKLSQKRFDKGAFYVSVIMRDDKFQALDGRFYIETVEGLQPTRDGFRVPRECVISLCRVLERDLREIGEVVLFEKDTFQFHIRYVNDKYGEGIDFRKYQTTEKYTGWGNGIRMKLEDVKTLRDWLGTFKVENITESNIIFTRKDIIQKDGAEDAAAGGLHGPVNPVINGIIDS